MCVCVCSSHWKLFCYWNKRPTLPRFDHGGTIAEVSWPVNILLQQCSKIRIGLNRRNQTITELVGGFEPTPLI